jgi:hypothetical protein
MPGYGLAQLTWCKFLEDQPQHNLSPCIETENDSPTEPRKMGRRMTEGQITERRKTGRRVTERQMTECRMTEHRMTEHRKTIGQKIPNTEWPNA